MVNTLPSDLPYSFRYDLLAYKDIENRKKKIKKIPELRIFSCIFRALLKMASTSNPGIKSLKVFNSNLSIWNVLCKF